MTNRSQWKGPYVSYVLYKSLLYTLQKKTLNEIYTHSRNSSIVKAFLGYTFKVYTGRVYIAIDIKKEKLGFKLGSFVPTRFLKKKKK
jgi:small subunit ribosomal protein S19